ncbi:MAG: phage head completion protein [Selenomonadaceae bacterium]
MNIGKMNKRLKLLKYTETGPDEGFGSKCAWVEYKTVWAEMLKQRISPMVAQGDGQAMLVTQGFKIRPVAIVKGDKVSTQGHTYDVIDVDISDPSCYVLTTREVRP